MPHVLRPALFFFLVGTGALAACGQDQGSATSEPVGHSAEALATFPNEQPAFDFFLGKGLTPAQSAGIVGNLDVESGCDPTVDQNGGGPGRGLAQWSAGARWDTTSGDNVLEYATKQGENARSLQLQLEFIWFELTSFSDYGLTALKATTTASAATTAFANDFEGCGVCDTTLRIAYAQNVLARFGSDPADGGGSSGATGPACTVQPSGETGVCITIDQCTALGSHVSTAGFCPGAADVQCCTAVDSGASGSSSSGSSGSSGTSGTSGSGTLGPTGTPASSAGTGCAASGTGSPSSHGAVWLLGLAALVVARRRAR